MNAMHWWWKMLYAIGWSVCHEICKMNGYTSIQIHLLCIYVDMYTNWAIFLNTHRPLIRTIAYSMCHVKSKPEENGHTTKHIEQLCRDSRWRDKQKKKRRGKKAHQVGVFALLWWNSINYNGCQSWDKNLRVSLSLWLL